MSWKSLFYPQFSLIEFQEGWAVPEEDNGLIVLHMEITNGSRQIYSEAKKLKFMDKQHWSITRTNYSLMWLKHMCGMKSSVALRYFGNNCCQVIYGYRLYIFLTEWLLFVIECHCIRQENTIQYKMQLIKRIEFWCELPFSHIVRMIIKTL